MSPTLAEIQAWRHSWIMATRRSVQTTPDLFSTRPTVKAAEPAAVSDSKVKASEPNSPPRLLLPTDLAGALKRLADNEIDVLLAAITSEAKRRGRLPPATAKKRPATDAQARKRPVEHFSAGSLKTGQLNAVRAAFQAGVKPSAIARQFGISQSAVRKAIAQRKG